MKLFISALALVSLSSIGTYAVDLDCGGAYFEFEGQPRDQKAMYLSAAHCNGFINTGQYIYNSGKDYVGLVYATMTKLDIALFRVAKTVNDLIAEGETIYTLSRIPLANGEQFEFGQQTCSLQNQVYSLKEGSWTWHGSYKYDRGCRRAHGMSGFPLISTLSGKIVGVHNTGHDGGRNCTVNNPCEVDAAGSVQGFPGNGYGQPSHSIYQCINSNYEFDLDLESCELTGS